MPVIAHISDLHFGRDLPLLADALIDELGRLAPDLVAISGDLTQHGHRDELAAARAFVDRLPAPALAVPGNHDMPKNPWLRFAHPWRRWREAFRRPLEPVVRGDGYIAVGANTARAWGPTLDWSRGRINDAQLDVLEREFAGGDALRVLVAHHPFLLDEAARHRGLVGGAHDAMATLQRARVDLVLGGHVHMGYADTVGGIVVAQSGTTFSDRLKGEAQGFNLIDASRSRMVVEHYRAEGHAFERDEIAVFERRGQWLRAPAIDATSAARRTASGTSRPSAR
ncbi:MAG TPA: metallophosphoesterase family protein [Xanthomonadales bacterium]|nr:metallophosphoesterase family protein [Xanthomonadales bacterium]